jgi:hypothetical protein
MTKMLRRYLRTMITVLLLGLVITLALSLLIDPLWYHEGNRITQRNFGFNERVSKLNRLLANPDAYDCIIFGSSRTTLLNEPYFKDSNCFNLAISLGKVGEFVAFAEYLWERGVRPKTVYIGVDGFNFYTADVTETVPDYVRAGDDPPHWLRNYLTLDALQFSIRGLLGKSPVPRYYTADFTVDIEPGRRVYTPEVDALRPDSERSVPAARAYHPEHLAQYQRLLEIYSDQDVGFYVPPISLWRIDDFYRRGEIGGYLEGIHAVGQLGRPLLDFSVPSSLTIDPNRTYDGSHFDLDANRNIARSLESETCDLCVAVNGLSLAEYRQIFDAAYEARRAEVLEAATQEVADGER